MADDLIRKYFPNLTPRQYDQLKALGPLYEDWNRQINVISRQDTARLYERHILHSLAIARFAKFAPGTRLVDVGTGGGLPGIPLAILFPDASFHLVDSVGRKIKVVREIVRELKLENVTAEQARAEKLSGKYDFVLGRAVTRLRPFLAWIRSLIKENTINDIPNGLIALKGGDLSEEIAEAEVAANVIDISDYFEEEFFLTKKIVHVPLRSPKGLLRK